MYIKSIVLDGFKSYGNRVEVNGFDPEFNAITGLNGTGKSNILDSICFVLGITNLGQVRAGSLTELVYKNGQAGITKATVSITFDNRDKNQCPIGYENHNEITVTRQVVMGGKNKYQINGIVVQNKRVSDLFCSVQLNVNNPHFLIMQGRITKVLNMKPAEILSMVEEAAGTRMYEAKKQAAQKTIEKKDAKLRELNDIVKEEIAPKLQKLQDERSQYQEYQKVGRELENLTRLYVAYRYVNAEDAAKEAKSNVETVVEDIQSKKDNIKNNELEAKSLEEQVAELNRRLDEESGSALKQLETELQGREKEEAASAAQHKALAESVSSHERRGKLLARSLADDRAALAAKQATLDEASSTFDRLRAASEAAASTLADAQNRFLAVSSGLEGDAGASSSLQDQLIAAKQEASEAATKIKQHGMERKHCEERLRTLRKEFDSSSSQHRHDQATIDAMEADVKKLETELSRLDFSEERSAELREACRALQATARGRREQTERLAGGLHRCDFHYTDPQPAFDRRRVKGTVCRLIDVCQPLYCTALETAAGGKLYNVVVDTDATSKLLLQRGRLQARTTIIPLNKIRGSVIDRATVQLAQQIGGGPDNVQLALDLVSFDSELTPAMQWVFGQTLVCRDLETAKRVCFHERVRRRCVTLDGDVFEPSGTLSGGARQQVVLAGLTLPPPLPPAPPPPPVGTVVSPPPPHPPPGASVLLKLQELKALERQTEQAAADCARHEAELQSMQRSADTYADLKRRYELSSHELQVIRARLQTTSHHQLHQEIQELQGKLEEHAAAVREEQARQQDAAARARDLEAKVKDIKGHREREFKKAEEALKKAKKAAESSSGEWKGREQEYEALQLEVSELGRSVAAALQQLEADGDVARQLREQLTGAHDKLSETKRSVKEVQDRIRTQKAEISSRNSDIARLTKNRDALAKANADLALRIKELEYRAKELGAVAAEQQKKIAALEAEHGWIESERQFFGAAGGLYDFAARQAGVAAQRIAQLQERRDKLTRGGVNARAHTLLGKEEEQYKELMNKKRIVEQDRAKLVQVMAELDEKKKKTLITACEQVNRDFGSIFSSLLPGAQAKLKPPDGQTVLDGLEVKIGFNKVWKESLGELSGGQRSLVALSLVLAMLLFKPAPLYILDEVDAALDLSHTQNIGAMLKEHFRHSQFIIVSLKDGMFNNANVLFRTKFVDGMSTVQRTVNHRS